MKVEANQETFLVREDVIYEKQFIMLWSRKDTAMVTCRSQSLLDCFRKHDERWWLVNVHS